MSYFARRYDAHHKIEQAFKSFGADHPTGVIRTENDPRWRQSETDPGLRAVCKNGPAASEPCRRSEWLLHGPDPSVVQPNTRLRRGAPRATTGSPRVGCCSRIRHMEDETHECRIRGLGR